MIAIIDYQMGNLRSVQKGFEKVGHQAIITSDPEVLARADKVVLPGVGAFGDAIAELRRRELVEPIRQAVDSGKPFLGICLGLQLLFDVGYESGRARGPGHARRRSRALRRAAGVQSPAHGLEPVAVPRPFAIVCGPRRRRPLLLRPLLLRRAERPKCHRRRSVLSAAVLRRRSAATISSPRSSTPRRASATACICCKNFAEL